MPSELIQCYAYLDVRRIFYGGNTVIRYTAKTCVNNYYSSSQHKTNFKIIIEILN